jgi:hypothetical protein
MNRDCLGSAEPVGFAPQVSLFSRMREMSVSGKSLRSAQRLIVWGLFSPLALTGCGEAPETKVAVTPVTGTLTIHGEKVVGARIVLHPQGHPLPEGRIAVGKTKADGTYAVTIYDDPQGIPPGEYVGTVEYYKPVDGSTGPNVVSKPYDKPDTSPIKVSVKDSPITVDPIDIKR